jgi:hypothetical protein
MAAQRLGHHRLRRGHQPQRDPLFHLYPGTSCTGTPLRTAETVTLTNETPATTYKTNNTDVKVAATASVSWLVTFTSTDPLVSGSSQCETTSLTITN